MPVKPKRPTRIVAQPKDTRTLVLAAVTSQWSTAGEIADRIAATVGEEEPTPVGFFAQLEMLQALVDEGCLECEAITSQGSTRKRWRRG